MKKMMTTIFSGVILASSMLVSPVSAAIHSNVPQDVEKFAETNGLAEAKRLLLTDLNGVGLTASDVSNLQVGPGLQINVVDFNKLQSSDDSSLLPKLKPVQEWEFLLESNGVPKTVLVINKVDGKLAFALTGGAKPDDLVKAWNLFETSSQGKSEPVLVKDREIAYIAGTVNGREVVVPAVSGNKKAEINNMDNSKLWSSDDAVKLFKGEVNHNQPTTVAEGVGGVSVGTNSSGNNSMAWWVSVSAAAVLGAVGLVSRKKRKSSM